MFNTTIELITYSESVNDVGDKISETPSYKKVFANQKGVRQSEFYQAAAIGLKPEYTFEIRVSSYSGEKKIRYGGETGILLEVIRTYQKNKDFIELICQGGVSHG
ncbi:MAG: phage head closure protein [Clostridia bacterium]|nr:phage head closure protein [Clostridia bacterium]